MRPYADTNFFTRLYLQLPDTPVAVGWAERAKDHGAAPVPITWLHRIEFVNAVQQHIFAGKAGQMRVTSEQAAISLSSFREDVSRGEFLCASPTNLQELERQFEELALRYTAKYGFRTYDLLHVASALLLQCDTFWSFDSKAAKLAALEGLKIHQSTK